MSGDNTSKLLKITVELAGKKYGLTIREEQEAAYRKAAKLVNDTYNNIIQRSPSSQTKFDMASYLALAAMEIGLKYQLVKEEEGRTQKELEDLDSDLAAVFDK